ncbi:MAG: hybrid sensor histidine kinase/response regulator [Candidatus Omnitrophica bacterium]|nr:hybrid sensor histidine kinase/response regulator [Candidatus Omnitrophota bacterium]MDD5487832.1 hybrid sensor histidine kinase/response regulator [Candidatus Omnitrophota bacterium]
MTENGQRENSLLVVDDEASILNTIKRLLRGEHYGVLTTSDPEEALSIIAGEKIKVIISDQHMPGVSGIELLSRVKEKYPDVVRIMFTGYTDMTIAEEAINRGEVYRFINKPWDDRGLRNIINDALEKYDMVMRNRILAEELARANTGLVDANEKLRNMYEKQKDFSSTVSHELKSPLATINLMLDVLISGTPGELTPRQKDLLEKTRKHGERLRRLIEDILDLSKMESGRDELVRQPDDMNSLIHDVVDVLGLMAGQKGLKVEAELSPGIPAVNMNRDKMNQVIFNLVDNAIKFTDRGSITVKSDLSEDGAAVLVSVVDTGMGIAGTDKEKLFDKFRQLGDPATRKTGGTGLGLAICREIVQRHGGRIWVESDPGRGSVFSFTIPIKG